MFCNCFLSLITELEAFYCWGLIKIMFVWISVAVTNLKPQKQKACLYRTPLLLLLDKLINYKDISREVLLLKSVIVTVIKIQLYK